MKKKILIVDDDSRNIFALSAILKAKNFETVNSENVKDALQILKNSNDIGVILLDMMMPDIDGYEALSLIKANTDLKRIPVIAVTAQAMKGDREKCLAAGADNYLSKPIDIDACCALLNEIL